MAIGPGVSIRNFRLAGVMTSRFRASEKNAKTSARGFGRRIDARRMKVPGSPSARSWTMGLSIMKPRILSL